MHLNIPPFDIFFFVVVVLAEVYWFFDAKRKDKRERENELRRDLEMIAFKKEVSDQLVEIGQRLELAIELPQENRAIKHFYFCPVCENEYEGFADSPCPRCPIIKVEAAR